VPESSTSLGPIDVLGSRAKIALVVPETNTVVQPESEAFRPTGVTNHVGRMPASGRQSLINDPEAYRRSLAPSYEPITRCMGTLAPCRPDAYILGHSINSFWGGVEGATILHAHLLSVAGGVPVTIPSLALLEAVAMLRPGTRRVAILTPYFPPGDELVANFFRGAGHEVTAVLGLRCTHPLDIASRGREEIAAAVSALVASGPELIIQPGTNLATARLVSEFEVSTGVPFLACNSVNYWHCLRTLGIMDSPSAGGLLFATA
jgi:maleate isomerase